MKEYFVYIDESGDPVFSDKATKYFIVCAVIIGYEHLESNGSIITDVKEKYKLNELKSSKETNENRRLSICKDLLACNLQIATIYVDKEHIHGDWFKHKPTFYKYIQRLLNHRIYQTFKSVNVTLDKYGTQEYQDSLKLYLDKKLQQELFEPEVFIDTAKKVNFIQLSDYLAGTLRKALQNDFENNEEFFILFGSKWTIRINLPDRGGFLDYVPENFGNISFRFCIDETKRYLESNIKLSHTAKYKTLEYLYYSSIDNDDWVYTNEIQSWLVENRIYLHEEKFRNIVTAALRDEGLIIVSSRKGIKIPTSLQDYIEYVQFAINFALPVLKRLKRSWIWISAHLKDDQLNEILSEEMKRILEKVDA